MPQLNNFLLQLIVATRPLFYRALLQQLLVEHFAENFPSGIIGRMAHKFDSFSSYASEALLKLKADLPVRKLNR